MGPNLSDWLRREAHAIAQGADFLYQEALLDWARRSTVVHYVKRDFLFKPGVWRGMPQAPVQGLGRREVLVVGHSDLRTGSRDIVKLRARTPAKIFCGNLDCPQWIARVMRAEPIPLGLSNPTEETPLHGVLGNHSQIVAVMTEDHRSSEPRVYSNFDSSTATQHRTNLASICESLEFVTVGVPEYSEAGRLRFLREMRDFRLVVCPRGNGMDTHRFWEALYVGAVPIVLAASYQAKIARRLGLPFIGLASWEGLRDNRGILRRADEIFSSSRFSLRRARGSFWRSAIFGDAVAS